MGDVLSLLQHLVGVVAQIGVAALHASQMLHLLLTDQFNLLTVDAQLLKEEADHVACLIHETCQQVYGLNGLLTVALCQLDSGLHGLLGFDGKLVKCHSFVSFLYVLKLCLLSIRMFPCPDSNKIHTSTVEKSAKPTK